MRAYYEPISRSVNDDTPPRSINQPITPKVFGIHSSSTWLLPQG